MCWKVMINHVSLFSRLKVVFPFAENFDQLFATSLKKIEFKRQYCVLNGLALSSYSIIPHECFFHYYEDKLLINPLPIWRVDDCDKNYFRTCKE